ncbi:tryptophanase leader peptide [Grimontia hollisae]|nr:tryptophanase leader peptide [Grimontia hollisae]
MNVNELNHWFTQDYKIAFFFPA